MEKKRVHEIWPDEFEAYIDSHNESEYLLIDVRQPEEYRDEHIPGAKLVPLGQLESRIDEIPADRDTVFYCHSGARSRVAALITAEKIISESKIYTLNGGITAWESRLLQDMPRIKHFKGLTEISDYLYKAMELEKGACLFYRALQEKFSSYSFANDLAPLVKAEKAHALLVYGYLAQLSDIDLPGFETVFKNLKGDIVEGGSSFDGLMSGFEKLAARDACIHVMETALDIEFAAYDLYRILSEEISDSNAKAAFLSLAQAEKGHMRLITKNIDKCVTKAETK